MGAGWYKGVQETLLDNGGGGGGGGGLPAVKPFSRYCWSITSRRSCSSSSGVRDPNVGRRRPGPSRGGGSPPPPAL